MIIPEVGFGGPRAYHRLRRVFRERRIRGDIGHKSFVEEFRASPPAVPVEQAVERQRVVATLGDNTLPARAGVLHRPPRAQLPVLPAANGRRHERSVLFDGFTAGRRHGLRVAPGIIRLGAPLPVHSLTIDDAAANRSRQIQVTAGGGGGSPSSPRARRCVPRALFPLRVLRGRVEARERAVSPSLRPRGVRPVGEPRQRNSLTLTRLQSEDPIVPNSCGPDGCDLALLVFCLHVVAAEGTASPRGDRPGLVRTPQEVDHPEPVACQCGPVARRGRGGLSAAGEL